MSCTPLELLRNVQDVRLMWTPLAELADGAPRTEIETPCGKGAASPSMWKGKEYWKGVSTEFRLILKPYVTNCASGTGSHTKLAIWLSMEAGMCD